MTLYTRQQKRYKDIKSRFWTLWEKVRVGWFERIALKHVYYHVWNRWPVQVQCMKQGTKNWCTGTTQRDGEGRVSGWGTHVYLCVHVWHVHTCHMSCQYIAKPPQYCKVISLQLKLINELKKKQTSKHWSGLSLPSLGDLPDPGIKHRFSI